MHNFILRDMIPDCIIVQKFRNTKGEINIEEFQKYYINKSYSDHDIHHKCNHDQLFKIIRK